MKEAKMFGQTALKLLIGLTALSAVHGKCPFAGDISVADQASILAATEHGGENLCSDFDTMNEYTLYSRRVRSINDDKESRELNRVKRDHEIPQSALRSAVEDGMRSMEESKKELDSHRQNAGPAYMPKNDSAYGHYINFRVRQPSIDLHSMSTAIIRATKKLQQQYAHRFGMTPFTFTEFLRNHGYSVPELSETCRPDPMCRKNQYYRTLDGSCNNLKNPTWGMSRTALVRIAPPNYLDAIYQPQLSVSGHPLPSPSFITLSLFPDFNRPDPVWTRSTMVWGQFMAHDLALSPSTQSKDGPIQCCTNTNSGPLPPKQLHPACLPIEVPDFHPFYSKFGIRCLNFVRTMTVPAEGCKLGPGQQMNAVTAFLDLSPVYGSSDEVANALRVHHGGLLKSVKSNPTGGEVLPNVDDVTATCGAKSKSEPCYKAGDIRVNLHLDLAILQIMMMRWHNNIARKFQQLNPHWDDEKLYQEARKYCIAAYQHICYEEWLPIILGREFMERHGLLRVNVDSHGYVDDYNHRIPPAVINAHTAGAFRFLHSTVQGHLELLTPSRKVFNEIPLSDNFNRPVPIEQGENFHGLLRGMVTQPMQLSDHYFTHEMNGLLFKGDNPHGLDLMSIDIQRHRDHGLASYNDYRHICGLKKARKWEDFLDFIHPEKVKRLSQVYENVNDVDLEVGCALEDHVSGSLLGPTSLCIIAEQFYRSRVGDRFFYMNGKYGSYDPAKLAEIKKYTWSKLVCETSDGVHEIQAEGFRQLSDRNHIMDCREQPYINFLLWKE